MRSAGGVFPELLEEAEGGGGMAGVVGGLAGRGKAKKTELGDVNGFWEGVLDSFPCRL